MSEYVVEAAEKQGYRVVARRMVAIDKELYREAAKNVLYNDEGLPERRKYVDRMRSRLKHGGRFPPLVITVNERKRIWDGNHRIVALYENGVKTYPAIFIEK